MSRLLHEEIYCIGAGRTDAGVHAPCFYAHFDTDRGDLQNDPNFIFKLNCILPRDIAVYSVFPVESSSHARFDAISRTYLYRISQIKDPFNHEFAKFLSKKIEIDKMNEAAIILMDYIDFTSFSKSNSDVKTYHCNITHAQWTKTGNELHFTITANRFLRNMVRAIVGTLLDIGLGKATPESIRVVIEKKSRSEAGISVAACGLHLVKIQYPDMILKHNHLPY